MENKLKKNNFSFFVPTEKIEKESVIGIYPLSESGIYNATDALTKERIINDIQIMTPLLDSELLKDTELEDRIIK